MTQAGYLVTGFGWPEYVSGSSPTPFKYGGANGCQTDNDTGLILMGHRYYDTRIGRFISQDPAGDGDNWYAYADNNPVNAIDPDGLEVMDGPGSGLSPFEGMLGGGDGTLQRNLDFNSGYTVTTTTHSWEEQGTLGWDPSGHGIWVDSGKEVPGSDTWSVVSYQVDGGSIAALPWYEGGWDEIAHNIGKAVGLTNCFVAGTLIQEQGKKEPIQAIRKGEIVATRNLQTGKTEYRKVVRTFKSLAHDTITVQFADAKTGKIVDTLTATTQHPFYVPGRGMTALSDLGIGTLVVTRAGPAVMVHSLVRHHSAAGVFVYNIEVEGDHTYFVGNAGEWVHNASQIGGWIAKDVFSTLKRDVGQADFEKFVEALQKGIVGPDGKAGIKALKGDPGYTYELKINGSSARILGNVGDWNGMKKIIFTLFTARGFH